MPSRCLALSRHRLRLAPVLALIILGLGAWPLCAQPAPPSGANTARLEAGFAEAARMLKTDPRFATMTDAARRRTADFIAGNVLFALIHEIGHAIISEFRLPVLGHEEDAADRFAIVTRLAMGNAFSVGVLGASSTGWFMSDRRKRERKISDVFYAEHGLDRQRAYDIVCLMVGSDPAKFRQLAENVKLPEDRQDSCRGDFSNASWSWKILLEPHLRAAEQARMKFEVVYSASGRYKSIEKFLRRIAILDVVAGHLADRFAWRAPIRLEARTCGTPTARWDVKTRKLYVCYELVSDYAALYLDYAGAEGLAAAPRRAVSAPARPGRMSFR